MTLTHRESTTLARGIALVATIHAADIDKAGLPYILHPLDVMRRASSEFVDGNADAPLTLLLSALAHDVKEDHLQEWNVLFVPFLMKELSPEDAARVIVTVTAVSRNAEETYEEFIHRVRESDAAAIVVKICDLRSNLDRPLPVAELPEKIAARQQKYRMALARLRKTYTDKYEAA